MDDKIKNSDFFKSRIKRPRSGTDAAAKKKDPDTANDAPKVQKPSGAEFAHRKNNAPPPAAPEKKPLPKNAVDSSLKISGEVKKLLDELDAELAASGYKVLLRETSKIRRELVRRQFTVAVAGEFSRGKSTFVNNLLEKEFLPTGNLPTTAMLTKIRYNPNEMMIWFDGKGGKKQGLPVTLEAWDGLTADPSEDDPEGFMLVGIRNQWLQQTGIEIEDTPGAGDLVGKRAALVGEALRCDDGAIITVSATSALSMSEKLFIEQRLISPKTPYLMLIVTKLDQVPVKERSGVLKYIKEKLNYWKWNIPVFVPAEMEMPDDTYNSIMGLDKIRAELEKWVRDPRREELTRLWLAQKAQSVIRMAMDSIKEQELLIDADDDKRRELIEKKKAKLSDASLAWGELKREMGQRNVECYNELLRIIDENKSKITEKLQYEVMHSNNPQRWWQQDYPYRIKVELMNLSNTLDNFVNRRIADDIRWFNAMINNQFKCNSLSNISGSSKTVINGLDTESNVEFEDITRKRNIARVGTAAVTIASFAALSALGAMPIIATLGIGTGSSIITEKIFKDKVERQQKTLLDVLGKNVPEVIDNATAQTEANLKARYNEIISKADEQEKAWLDAQKTAIENSVADKSGEKRDKLGKNKAAFERLRDHFDNL